MLRSLKGLGTYGFRKVQNRIDNLVDNIEIVFFFFFRFLLTSPKHTKHTSRFTTAVTFVARPGGAAGISTERLGLRPRRPRPLWSAALLSTGRPLANLVLEEQGPRTHIPVCNNIYNIYIYTYVASPLHLLLTHLHTHTTYICFTAYPYAPYKLDINHRPQGGGTIWLGGGWLW